MGGRYALIIASYEYQDADLRQLVAPAQDAQALGEVLGQVDIGGFDVQSLINEPSHTTMRTIEAFFADRKRDDLLLLYFSGHGMKDEFGRLYYATVDSVRKQLRSTAISANFVNEVMRYSHSRQQVLLLDCCYSGAFAEGMVAKSDETVGAIESFKGRGRVVLTASDALQYAFEGDHVSGEGIRSVFTHNLVEGLATGKADLDQDGKVSLDELYDYIFDRVNEQMPQQQPEKWEFGLRGEIVIAKNPVPVMQGAVLPPELLESIEDLRPWVRKAAVGPLGKLLESNLPGMPEAAREALERLTVDDSRQVASAAKALLAEHPAKEQAAVEQVEEEPDLIEVVYVSSQGATLSSTLEEADGEFGKQEELAPIQTGTTVENITDERQKPLPRNWGGFLFKAIGVFVGLLVVGYFVFSLTNRPPAPPTPSVSPTNPSGTQEVLVPVSGSGNSGELSSAVVLTSTITSSPTPLLTTIATTPTITPSPTPFVLTGKITFASDRDGNREIYRMDADGSNLTRLTNSAADDFAPAWSPDGKQIAFSSDREGLHQIYIMDLNGGNITRLTENEGKNYAPSWSPDGKQIAFSSNMDGNYEIYSIYLDGSNTTRLTMNDIRDFDPAWSPSGDQIAFSSDRDGTYEIYKMDADGSNPTRLTDKKNEDFSPIWSPDGEKIAFSSDWEGSREIFVMDADGNNPTRLTYNDVYDNVSAWSPDGQMLLFYTDRDGNNEIYVMAVDGSNPVRLTNNEAHDGNPDWTP